MSQILGEKQELVFEIISARISNKTDEKKHVIYTLQVRFISGCDDLRPAVIERRYSDFLKLYNSLKKEQPLLMNNVAFPSKKILGNFDNELISSRSTGFEALLKYISSESKLRETKALMHFLQTPELTIAKGLLEKQEYSLALPLLENNFKLLNKVFTDRYPIVLLALCRLLGCSMNIPSSTGNDIWAELLIHRFEGVSDSDLLELYVPILQACKNILGDNDQYEKLFLERLNKLKRSGMKVEEPKGLLNEVAKVEKKIFGDINC